MGGEESEEDVRGQRNLEEEEFEEGSEAARGEDNHGRREIEEEEFEEGSEAARGEENHGRRELEEEEFGDRRRIKIQSQKL